MASSSNGPFSDNKLSERARPTLSDFFSPNAALARRAPSAAVPLPAHKKRSPEWWSEGLVRKTHRGAALATQSPVADSGSGDSHSDKPRSDNSHSDNARSGDSHRNNARSGHAHTVTTVIRQDTETATPSLDTVLVSERDSLVPVVATEAIVLAHAPAAAGTPDVLDPEDLAVLPKQRSSLGVLLALAAVCLTGWGALQFSSAESVGKDSVVATTGELDALGNGSLDTSSAVPAAASRANNELTPLPPAPATATVEAQADADEHAAVAPAVKPKPAEKSRPVSPAPEAAQSRKNKGVSTEMPLTKPLAPSALALLPEGSAYARFPDLSSGAQKKLRTDHQPASLATGQAPSAAFAPNR